MTGKTTNLASTLRASRCQATTHAEGSPLIFLKFSLSPQGALVFHMSYDLQRFYCCQKCCFHTVCKDIFFLFLCPKFLIKSAFVIVT